MKSVRVLGVALSLVMAATLWGCDRGGSSAPAREHSSEGGAASPSRASGDGGYSQPARPRTPAPMLDGKPMWADNRKHSAEENADYQFKTWGSSVGASDVKEYAKKARAFVDHPPSGAEKVSRPNGDVLIYDKGSNTFAIARRDGAPRLFRKPPGGDADWEKAKSEAPYSASNRSRKRYNAPNARDFSGGDN